MNDLDRARSVLVDLNPGALSYDEWLHVGMVLKGLGASADEWRDWSRRDPDRFVEREFDAKWNGFRGDGVGMGTLVEIAGRNGVRVPACREPDANGAFGWDDPIRIGPEARYRAERQPEPEVAAAAVVDERWVEADEIPAPAADWQPGDMIRYLESLFEPDEYVGIVADAWLQEESGRWLPKKGVCDRTRAELVDALRAAASDIGAAIGDPHPQAGAWVRVNPLDGQGAKDANVTAFRHALIEADADELGKQLALIRALRLPCSAVVHSGGKSIHAIVRVDAGDAAEYRKRVDRLYKVCAASGLKVDSANRNPSRLSRLPGVMRGERPQYMIDGRCGLATWEDWEAWIEEAQDDLPDPEPLADFFFDLPPLAPELITGILREGHKMRLTGPSKAGKSFALIELACAIAEGREWFGAKCRQGPVLYINLELDRASALHRFRRIYDALGWRPDTISAIDVWNLRGHAVPLDQLAPKLIRRAVGKGYSAVIFDPIYKLQWGDENDAGDVARFCNNLDRICYELKSACIDVHHHSKGVQGQKRSIDRGSGSGVFGRDPDAVLDMIELEIGEDRRNAVLDLLATEALTALATVQGLDLARWPIESRAPAQAALMAFQAAFPDWAVEAAGAVFGSRQLATRISGWRVEGTLREFAPLEARPVWFRHPVHLSDAWGLLADAKAAGEEAPWEASRREKADASKKQTIALAEALEIAVEKAGGPGTATVALLAGLLGIGEKAVRTRLGKSRKYGFNGGVVLARNGDD